MPKADNPSFHLRLDPELRKRIRVAAAQNERSITQEIASRLERSFSSDELDRAAAIKLLTSAILVLDRSATQEDEQGLAPSGDAG